MIKVDPNKVTAIIQEVAEAHILPYFTKLRREDIAFKIGDDPVTIADKEAESHLSARLLDLLPGSNTMGEEAFSANRSILTRILGESPTWIIDPIDGTRNFASDNPDFGVIVALAERNQTVAGWIYNPTSREVITTERGAGVWYKGERLKTLKPDSLSRMRGYFGDRLLDALQTSVIPIAERPRLEMTRCGAHEYPRLWTDQFFGHKTDQLHFRASLAYCTPWDDAAGILMHQEAGGYAAHWDGTPFHPANFARGVAIMPDEQSWEDMRNWVAQFAPIEELLKTGS